MEQDNSIVLSILNQIEESGTFILPKQELSNSMIEITETLERISNKHSQKEKEFSKYNDRLDAVQEVLMEHAKLNFSKKAEITGSGDRLDALALIVNTKGEEMEEVYDTLKNHELYIDSIVGSMLDMLIVIDKSGIILDVNKSFCFQILKKREDVIGKHLKEFIAGRGDFETSEINFFIQNGRSWNIEIEMISGVIEIPVLISGAPIKTTDEEIESIVCIAKNIIHQKNIQLEIEKSLKEKEILIKEIHHRVKNNLQVITSLLGLQASQINNEEVLSLIRYTQYRVGSMAMVHEMLYETRDLSSIDYSEYVTNLLTKLLTSMHGNQNDIALNVEVDNLFLNLDTAIPLGLILNELTTNSLKYAFKEGDENMQISVKIIQNKKDNYTLFYSDNGVGVPKEVNIRNSPSLGLKLIHGLTDQLRGSVELKVDNGSHFIINFNQILSPS